jgi:chromosome partitioning protein
MTQNNLNSFSVEDVLQVAYEARLKNRKMRDRSFRPGSEKSSPTLNGNQIAALCGISRNDFNRRLIKKDLPEGIKQSNGRYSFTVAEARVWARAYGRGTGKPENADAITMTVANSKGGVGKTTTTFCCAQALSLLSYKVLVIDLDPQGSLSSLAGYLPDSQIKQSQTILPFCDGIYNFKDEENEEEQDDDNLEMVDSLDYAVQPTYWNGIDIIPSCALAFGAEFSIPTRAMREPGFRFYDLLNHGIRNLKKEYDIILFDCPPTLSYLTIGAIWASNGLLVPIPPTGMNFSATAQFWHLFTTISMAINSAQTDDDKKKTWDFISIIFSMVDHANDKTIFMQQLINDTYGSMVVPIEIPKTNVASSQAIGYKTVYDLEKNQGSAKPAFDKLAAYLDTQIKEIWKK